MDPAARWLVTNRRNGDGRDAVPCQPPRQAAQGGSSAAACSSQLFGAREAQPHKKNCTEARAAHSEIKKICTQLEKLYWAERAEISGSLVSYRYIPPVPKKDKVDTPQVGSSTTRDPKN